MGVPLALTATAVVWLWVAGAAFVREIMTWRRLSF